MCRFCLWYFSSVFSKAVIFPSVSIKSLTSFSSCSRWCSGGTVDGSEPFVCSMFSFSFSSCGFIFVSTFFIIVIPFLFPLIHPCDLRRSEEHTSELQSRFDLVCRL